METSPLLQAIRERLLWLGGVCLSHGLWTVRQERVLQLRTKLQGLWQTDHKAGLALSSWNEDCTIPFTASPSQPRHAKVVKADGWGMPTESSTEYAGVLPRTTHSPLSWDLSLILSNKDELLTLLRQKKGEKVMPYFFLSAGQIIPIAQWD